MTLVCYEQEIITSTLIDHKSVGTDIKLDEKHPHNFASLRRFNASTEMHRLFNLAKFISI